MAYEGFSATELHASGFEKIAIRELSVVLLSKLQVEVMINGVEPDTQCLDLASTKSRSILLVRAAPCSNEMK